MTDRFPELADLRSGSEPAWSIAFSHLWPMALRAARKAGPGLGERDAEEAASDAVRTGIEQIDAVSSEASLRALVALVARRRAVSILRGRFAAKRAPDGVPPSSLDLEAHPGGESFTAGDLGRDLNAAEAMRLLWEVLGKLDTQTSQLLADKYFQGYSYEELSRKYGQPVGTLCPQVMRAVRKVRDLLRGSPSLMQELRDFLRHSG